MPKLDTWENTVNIEWWDGQTKFDEDFKVRFKTTDDVITKDDCLVGLYAGHARMTEAWISLADFCRMKRIDEDPALMKILLQFATDAIGEMDNGRKPAWVKPTVPTP